MRCAKCGTENRAGRKFCAECGQSIVEALPKLRRRATSRRRNSARSAGATGQSAQPPVDSLAQRNRTIEIRVSRDNRTLRKAIDGERKTVTALFADIKGSTELMEDLDPEEARAIIDPALKLMIDAVRRYDGYVVQSTGDGIFALFGAPVAHEDHPQRALYAALRMQEELKRYSAKVVAQTASCPIEGRVGVNTGEVVVRSITTGAGQTEYTPIGHTDQSRFADADTRADRFDRGQRDTRAN